MKKLFYDGYGYLREWVVVANVILAVCGVVLAFAAVVVFLGYQADKHTCYEKIDSLNIEGDYGFWSGCNVTVDGQRIPLDQYFVNNPTDDQ